MPEFIGMQMPILCERYLTAIDSRLLLRDCDVEWQSISSLNEAKQSIRYNTVVSTKLHVYSQIATCVQCSILACVIARTSGIVHTLDAYFNVRFRFVSVIRSTQVYR